MIIYFASYILLSLLLGVNSNSKFLITNCCNYVNELGNLHVCVKESAEQNAIRMNTIMLPEKPFLLVSYASDDILNYSSYSFAINEAYCELNNCIVKYLNSREYNYEPRDQRWNKIKILSVAINEWGFDGVLWVDADLVIMDMNFKVFDLLKQQYPASDILISAESSGSSTMVNTGAVLVRKSDFSREFLDKWWGAAEDRIFYSDQEQFDIVYNNFKNIGRSLDPIVILPPDSLNSDPPAMTQQRIHNPVLHLMGELNSFREKVFSYGFLQFCTYAQSNNYLEGMTDIMGLPLQLGMTQSNLLNWTLEVYSNEVDQGFNNYALLANTGGNNLDESDTLANAVHHLAHALEHTGHPEDIETAQSLRFEVFSLLLENLTNKRGENELYRQSHGKIHPDWPEHMKKVATAGQHLLGFGSEQSRRHAASIVMSLLEELNRICHPSQKPAILLMVSYLHTQIGVIDINAGKVMEAHKHFQTAFDISKVLSKQSGEHILEEPMSLLANTYSMLGQFHNAFPLYEEVIRLSERSAANKASDKLIQYILNAGIAHSQNDDIITAGKYLLRAQEILDTAGILKENFVHRKILSYLESKVLDDP